MNKTSCNGMAMDNDRHQMMSSNTQVDSLYKSGFFFNLSGLFYQRNMEMEKWFKT